MADRQKDYKNFTDEKYLWYQIGFKTDVTNQLFFNLSRASSYPELNLIGFTSWVFYLEEESNPSFIYTEVDSVDSRSCERHLVQLHGFLK